MVWNPRGRKVDAGASVLCAAGEHRSEVEISDDWLRQNRLPKRLRRVGLPARSKEPGKLTIVMETGPWVMGLAA